MGRPARSLEQHIRQGSFRSRRHHRLLAGESLPAEWLAFSALQARYRAATSDAERAAIGLQFEQTLDAAHARATERGSGLAGPSLDEHLTALCRPGSLAHLLQFFPAFLRYPSGPLQGQPLQLEPWQKPFLREFHRRDRTGRRVYKKALLGLPAGNGMSTLAAGLGLYELLCQRDGPQVVLAAGSREQARLGIECARRIVAPGPLSEWILSSSNRLDCAKRQAQMHALSSQGALQHGRAPAAALLDQLWTFTSPRQIETYRALTAGIHKRPDAYLLATSTAGTNRDSLLGRIYDRALTWEDVTVRAHGCLTVAKNPKAGTLVWWYAAPADADPSDPKILRACNPASWISLTELQQQLHDPGLNESDFRRLHLNQWPRPTRSQRPGRKTPAGSWPKPTFDELLTQIEANNDGR